MPPWHLSRSGMLWLVGMRVCQKMPSKWKSFQCHLAALQEYTAKSVILTLITIPACPDVQLWQGESVCVRAWVQRAASAPSFYSSHCFRVCAGCQGSRYTEMQTTAGMLVMHTGLMPGQNKLRAMLFNRASSVWHFEPTHLREPTERCRDFSPALESRQFHILHIIINTTHIFHI